MHLCCLNFKNSYQMNQPLVAWEWKEKVHCITGQLGNWRIVILASSASTCYRLCSRKKCVTFLENENDLLICIIWHDYIVDRARVREFRAWGMLLFVVSLLSMVSLRHAVGPGHVMKDVWQTFSVRGLKMPLRRVWTSGKESNTVWWNLTFRFCPYTSWGAEELGHWYWSISADRDPVVRKVPRGQTRLTRSEGCERTLWHVTAVACGLLLQLFSLLQCSGEDLWSVVTVTVEAVGPFQRGASYISACNPDRRSSMTPFALPW